WGVDVVVSGSQKALMTPPGIALVSVSEAAWERRAEAPRFYFDWGRTRDAQARLDAAFTPAVSLVAGLDVALGLVLVNGLAAAFARVELALVELGADVDRGVAVTRALEAWEGTRVG